MDTLSALKRSLRPLTRVDPAILRMLQPEKLVRRLAEVNRVEALALKKLKLRCPVCKMAYTNLVDGLLDDAYVVCGFCGQVAIYDDGRMRVMTVKEYLGRDKNEKAAISRAIAKAPPLAGD
jgi:hypothetical protein